MRLKRAFGGPINLSLKLIWSDQLIIGSEIIEFTIIQHIEMTAAAVDDLLVRFHLMYENA